jgi:steroid 5-alpha reductase family enzyme
MRIVSIDNLGVLLIRVGSQVNSHSNFVLRFLRFSRAHSEAILAALTLDWSIETSRFTGSLFVRTYQRIDLSEYLSHREKYHETLQNSEKFLLDHFLQSVITDMWSIACGSNATSRCR